MGKKSSAKAKEKKIKHKQELAIITAKLALIEAANSQEDPLSTLVPFKKFERNGLNLSISCKKVDQLDETTLNWSFELIKSNMHKFYEMSGWGWNDKQKRQEMEHEKMWFLLAHNILDPKDPVAVVTFRFDLNDDEEVLYCYEIQLQENVKRKGLGKFLMQILELLAYKSQMAKVVLTVFKENMEAQQFFKTKLKYELDRSNPDNFMMNDREEWSYEILSKMVGPKQQNAHVNSNPCSSSCCHHH